MRSRTWYGTRLLFERAAPLTLLFVFSSVGFLVCMVRFVNVFDEGIILAGTARVLDGEVIHRDFYSLHGPANYYSLAWLFRLFSPSVLVERLWDTGVKSVTVALVFHIVNGLTGWRFALYVALICFFWIAHIEFYNYPVFPALAAALFAVICLLADLENRKPEFILNDPNWDESKEANSSSVNSGAYILDDYIHGRFKSVQAHGTLSILQRIPRS